MGENKEGFNFIANATFMLNFLAPVNFSKIK